MLRNPLYTLQGGPSTYDGFESIVDFYREFGVNVEIVSVGDSRAYGDSEPIPRSDRKRICLPYQKVPGFSAILTLTPLTSQEISAGVQATGMINVRPDEFYSTLLWDGRHGTQVHFLSFDQMSRKAGYERLEQKGIPAEVLSAWLKQEKPEYHPFIDLEAALLGSNLRT